MTGWRKLGADSVRSLRLWRVWKFLGIQDIKARFRRSFIGPAWLLLNMAFFVGGVGGVYGLIFGQPMNEFLPFLTAGFVIWGFIVSSLTESGMTFINAEGYIKQFCYPKQIYLFRALVGYLVIFLIGISALVPVQLFYDRFHPLGWLLALPGLALLLLAALGQITICAYLGTRFRDLPHALGGLLQVLFFVTPIMFPVEVLRQKHLDFVYQLNPLHYLIDVVRHPILTGGLAVPENYYYAGLYVLAVWLLAGLVANRLDSRVVFLL
jgi:lipopolysaccharide transport system permease protein